MITILEGRIDRWKRDNPVEGTAFAPEVYHDFYNIDFLGIDDIDVDRRRRLSAFFAMGFANYFVCLEQSLVPQACEFLAGLPLAPHLNPVLESVQVQEVHHSTWASELEVGLRKHIGFEGKLPTPHAVEVIASAIESLRAPDYEPAGIAYALVIAEVLDFGTAASISRDSTLDPLVRGFAMQHEVEERLHRVFFRCVLEDMWKRLGEESRGALAEIRHSLVRAFIEPDLGFQDFALRQCDVEAQPRPHRWDSDLAQSVDLIRAIELREVD